MMFLKQYCPTFRRISLWLWNSPTFTTWGKFLVQSLGLFALTPLILTRFNETEIAAWYLFASLNFFGTIVTQRLGITFSRMFAFAMAGSSNLAPIKGRKHINEESGEPNWDTFERAYSTIGSFNLGIGWVNVVIALGMGLYALRNILEGYGNALGIWTAFAIMQLISLVGFVFQRYSIALQGMNYVALSNRWQMLFSVFSICLGCLSLILGADILILVIVIQTVAALGVLRNRVLLGQVEGGRVLRFKPYGFDREVFGWAWEPTWKGFLKQFGTQGGLHLTSVIYSGIGTKGEVASYFFSLRMLAAIDQIARAPVFSIQPLFSKLRARGDLLELGRLYRVRTTCALSLLAVGGLAAVVILPVLLDFIGSNVGFVERVPWLLLVGLTLVVRFNAFCANLPATGNQILFYWQPALAALIGAVFVLALGECCGVFAPILASTLPILVLLNFAPLKLSSKFLEQRVLSSRLADFVAILLIFTWCSIFLV